MIYYIINIDIMAEYFYLLEYFTLSNMKMYINDNLVTFIILL